MHRTRPILIVCVISLATLVLSAACTGEEPEPEPSEPDAASVSYESAPCPNPIYGTTTDFDLPPEYTCGYLTVPEDRSDPGGPTIRIAVAVRPATDPNPKPDPIVFLSGGPGGSGIAEGPGVAKAWHPDRDVIFVDQRGALKSEPFLACPEVDEYMRSTEGMSWSDPATREQSAAVLTTCRDRLTADGWNLGMYNTTESTADLADLRVAMGIDEWNVYGVSYGSDFALQLLRDHPEGLRTVIVDAVVPPDVDVIETGWLAGNESASAIYDECAAQPECSAAFPAGIHEYVEVVNDLAANPRTVRVTDPRSGEEVDVVVDAYKLTYTVAFATLLGSIPKIPSLIHNLAVGDGSEAALEVLAGRFPPSFNSYGLQWGVLCSEMIGPGDLDVVQENGAIAWPGFPTAVTDLPAMFPWAFSDCAAWDVPAAPAQAAVAATSETPVLLTSGQFDATAPPSYALHASQTLPNSQQLVFAGVGHSASRWAPECFATVLAGFLDEPLAPVDQSCVDAITVPPFVVP